MNEKQDGPKILPLTKRNFAISIIEDFRQHLNEERIRNSTQLSPQPHLTIEEFIEDIDLYISQSSHLAVAALYLGLLSDQGKRYAEERGGVLNKTFISGETRKFFNIPIDEDIFVYSVKDIMNFIPE